MKDITIPPDNKSNTDADWSVNIYATGEHVRISQKGFQGSGRMAVIVLDKDQAKKVAKAFAGLADIIEACS